MNKQLFVAIVDILLICLVLSLIAVLGLSGQYLILAVSVIALIYVIPGYVRARNTYIEEIIING
jgi:hypothetical protein